MNIQSIIFDKNKYKFKQCLNYLYGHNYKALKVDETKNFFRFRQKAPKQNYKYMTKDLKNGIKYIIIVNKTI